MKKEDHRCTCHEKKCSCESHEHRKQHECHKDHEHSEQCKCHHDQHEHHEEYEHSEQCKCHHEHHDHDTHEHCHCHHDHHGGAHDHDSCCCEEGIERLETKKIFLYIIGAVVLLIAFLPMLPQAVRWVAAGAVYLAFGFSVWKEMIEGFAHKRIFTEFTLMCAASVGALVLQEYADAAAVMYLYALGETISGLASGRARKNIADLISITPEQVTVMENGTPRVCHPEEVALGAVVLVRAGERIPLDGVVQRGAGSADTSSVTGEQLPAELSEGSTCLSGSVLISGSVEISVTHTYENSVASQLKRAVEEASHRKAVREKKISRFAAVVTPAAFGAGLLIFLIGTAITGEAAEWFRRGLVILVCSCPCSLILSIPLTYFAGIGSAAGQGIVFRGGEIVDATAKLEMLFFDKTGTLTESTLCFESLIAASKDVNETKIHQIAYSVLLHSPHVAAQTYCAAMGNAVEACSVSNVENLPGRGIRAELDGKQVICGNAKMLKEAGMDVPCLDRTAIYLAFDGRYLGALCFSTAIKADAAEAITALRECGVSRMVILSGDVQASVDEVASAVSVDEAYGERMPAEKREIFEALYEDHKKAHAGTVGFCGDGLNDSAVIAASDVGIAMGRGGSAVTVEAADVVLMDDSPRKIAVAVRLSRRIVRIANQNIALSLGLKLAIAAVCVAWLPSMELALVADVGAAVLTVLNAMRAGKSKG